MPFTGLACELQRIMVASGEEASDNAAMIKLHGDGAKD